MIAGVTTPTAGAIDIDGKVTSVLTLGVGLKEEATGRDNIFIDGELQEKTREEIALVIDRIIDFSELREVIDRPVRTYSTGMKARLAFSIICEIDPEILLIDEALSVGDAFFAQKATRRIKDICKRGQIALIVSHSMPSIRDICTRCIWLRDGKVVMDGPPDTVTAAYVKAVRKQDEEELERRHASRIGGHSMREGWSVGDLQLSADHNGAHRVQFHEGQAVNVACRILFGDRTSTNPLLWLKVERLDGMVFVEEAHPVAFPGADLTISIPGNLSAATYTIDMWLQINGEVVARRAAVFRVVTDSPHAGGRPALHYPILLSVTQPT